MKLNLWIIVLAYISAIYAQKPTLSHKDTFCGSNGNTDTICSPKPTDVWKNGTRYQITWNSMYPSYVSEEYLSIYIYLIKNYQKIKVKQWSDIDPSNGSIVVLVDDSWRLDSTEKQYDCLVYILPSEIDPLKEMNSMFSDYPTPIFFHVAQAALSLSTFLPKSLSTTIFSTMPTITNTAPLSKPTQSPITAQPTKENLHPWIIAAICIASIAALGACVSLCWILFRRKRWTDQGKTEPEKKVDRPYAHPLNNVSDMTVVTPVIPDGKHIRLQSSSSLSKEPPLSSNEAHILATAFRETMRCPEWQTEQERRKAGDALLKKELEIEGTIMKKVGKRLLKENTPTTT